MVATAQALRISVETDRRGSVHRHQGCWQRRRALRPLATNYLRRDPRVSFPTGGRADRRPETPTTRRRDE